MESHGASTEEFGKDLGLVHEAVITGRKIGVGRDFWSRLAHDEDLFRRIVSLAIQPESQDELAKQARFWREVFGIELDLADITVPKKRNGFNWLIVIPEGMTPSRVFDNCAKEFRCERYGVDLDAATKDRNDREATKTYAVRFCDRVEADEELKNLSADDLKKTKIPGNTLLERLILGRWYFWKFRKHLDIDNITLCSGSRDGGGDVPRVSWCDGEMCVYWFHPASRRQRLRSRQVVS